MGTSTERTGVVVIGGGVAGLTVATTVLAHRPDTEIVVLEAADRPGGKAITTAAGGYVFEHGPASIRALTDEVRTLLEWTGLTDRVETSAAAGSSASIWVNGRLRPIPTGLVTAATTGILSARGKARVLAEPLLGRRGPAEDETVAGFARRRFGAEAARVVVGAMVQGVTGGDPEETGLEAFSPGLYRIDRAAGDRSLVGTMARRGIRGLRSRSRGRAASGATERRASRPAAVSLRDGGLGVLVEAMAAGLGCRLRTGSAVREITRTGEGRFSVVDSSGHGWQADTVVVAVPSWAAAGMLEPMAPQMAKLLGAIEYNHMRVVGLGYPLAAFASPPRGFGFLSPRDEGLSIMGASISSNLFPSQAPEGHLLIRAFAGGAFAPEMVDLPTSEAVSLVERDIRRALGVEGTPEFVQDAVWRNAIPQYGPGHLGTVGELDRLAAEFPGLHLAGNSYRGIGLKDTIAEAVTLGRALADGR